MNDINELNRLDEELAFKITIDGKEVICYILLVFDNPSTGKKYVIYTDGNKDDDGKMEILASVYEIENNNVKLGEITTNEEWDMVDEMLNRVGEINE